MIWCKLWRAGVRWRVLGLWVLATVVGLTSSRADEVRLGPLPLPVASGIAVNVAVEAVGGNGYQPVHLTVRPRGKSFNRDRRLSVVLTPENSQQTFLDFQFQAEIFAPESGTIVQETFLVPHYFPWDHLTVELSEDGQRMRGGRNQFAITSKLRARDNDQIYSVGIVLPKDEATQDAAWKTFPDVRGLVTVLGNGPIPEDEDTERLKHKAALTRAKSVQPALVQFRVVEEANLPRHWLGHSQLDVIIVAAPVLERMTQEQPAEAKAIEKWLAAGGSLWVYASDLAPISLLPDSELSKPPTGVVLAKTAVLNRLDLPSKNDTSRLSYQSWGVIKESQIYGFDNNFVQRRSVYNDLAKAKHPLSQVKNSKDLVEGLRIGSFGLGTVVTIAEEDPFPGSYQLWYSLLAMHPPQQMSWIERMGIDVPAGNDNYWMWLIPSVGQPPVKSFVFLNALFALLVGPLCYFYFRRRGRLYLLYFVAPLMALIITISLFVFALMRDGVQTKLRSRQITWVDAKSGNHVRQARQTYYSVIGSDRGIRTSDQVALYPVRYSPTFDYRYYGGRDDRIEGQVVQAEEERVHRGSFYPSRSQVQYLSMDVVEDQSGIEFSAADTTVTNEMKDPLQLLIVRDQQGKYWITRDLEPGGEQKMTSAGQTDVQNLLGPEVRPPLGEVPMLRRSYYRTAGMMTAGIQVSLLETWMDEWALAMPVGSFVALAEIDQERLGVEDATVLDSVHVIMGMLQ